MTKVRLELLTDIDMPLFIEKGIRGGVAMIGHRYAKANNVYLSTYDSSLPTKQLNRRKQLNSTVVSRNETTQLCSGTKQPPATAYNRLQTAYNAYNRLQLQPPATACNRLQPPAPLHRRPATAYNRLQPPATACNRLQPPAPPAPPLQQNRLFLQN
ncbi:hypothetical protein TNCV_63181 [Trichonephila clavipes]|nr:hypothetical protein TNCV_63181 [Trichonephila clavipes]